MYNELTWCISTEIKIGGHSCLDTLEYSSSKKLFCLTPNIVGSVEIIIETLSGGKGTCTVSYSGRPREATPLLGEACSIHLLGEGFGCFSARSRERGRGWLSFM